jgi:DNA-binding NtrC family response regulator
MKNTVVAIFEDDKVNCFIHEKLFNFVKAPVTCHLFDNPEKGYEAAREIEFDIVFIEIHFWGDNLSGLEILKKLKEIQRKEFIAVAMTALLQVGDAERIMAAGFTMCIEKPLIFKEINGLLNIPFKK